MEIPTKEIKNRARKFAKNLLAQAEKNEPPITADLQKIASEVSAEIVGLENKFKTVQSLTQKITGASLASAQVFADLDSNSIDRVVEKSVKRQALRNNDALRYTFIFPIEKYVFGYKQAIEKLRQNQYEIPENRIWNAWKNIGTIFDKGYRGINITVISSENQKFELQFHTRESYELKIKTHPLYKLLRLGVKVEQSLRAKVPGEIIELARNVRTPKGAKKL